MQLLQATQLNFRLLKLSESIFSKSLDLISLEVQETITGLFSLKMYPVTITIFNISFALEANKCCQYLLNSQLYTTCVGFLLVFFPLPVKLLNICLTIWQGTIKTKQTQCLKVQTDNQSYFFTDFIYRPE